MADWNSELYLKFKAERTQPAHDLAARIPLRDARSILDIGCGPGNSTAAVAARYPGARVLGVDSSENMVAAACAAHPEFEFRVCEAPQGLDALGGGFDIIFSQRVPAVDPGAPDAAARADASAPSRRRAGCADPRAAKPAYAQDYCRNRPPG